MASDNEAQLRSGAAKPPPLGEAAMIRRLPSFRVGTHRVAAARRRKMDSARLGGGDRAVARRGRWWGGGSRLAAAAARRLRGRRRLRWLSLRCLRVLRAMRSFYAKLLRDIVEASASPGAAEARYAIESLFSMPAALPISLAAVSAPRLL